MLPISASDIIEFRPADERVKAAAAKLKEAEALEPANPVAVKAAEDAMADAERAQAEHDPVYCLRVPTIRSKARANADLVAEGVLPRDNASLIAALLSSPADLSPEDSEFVKGLDAVNIALEAWPRVYWIARAVPEAARILAERSLHALLSSVHNIRHHLILDGQRSPLSEASIEALPEADVQAIADKIEGLMYPSKAEAKN